VSERSESGAAAREPDGLPAALLRDPATWAEPPDGFFARIEAALPAESDAAVLPVAPVVSRRRWQRPLFTAAAIVAALACGVLIGRIGGTSSTDHERVVATFTLTAVDPAATLSADGPVFDRGVGFVYRLSDVSLPPAAADDYYEGWVESAAGERVSIGTFHMRGEGVVSLWSGVDVAAYPTVVITNRAGDELLRGPVTLT